MLNFVLIPHRIIRPGTAFPSLAGVESDGSLAMGSVRYVGVTEVTQGQYDRFAPRIVAGEFAETDKVKPITGLQWHDAAAFCRKFGFELPTSAIWGYCCGAGRDSMFPWGDVFSDGQGYCNVVDISYSEKYGYFDYGFAPWNDGCSESVGVVAAYLPNALGLYDMVGNACEWCSDSPTLESKADVKMPLPIDGQMLLNFRMVGGCPVYFHDNIENAYRTKSLAAIQAESISSEIGFRVMHRVCMRNSAYHYWPLR